MWDEDDGYWHDLMAIDDGWIEEDGYCHETGAGGNGMVMFHVRSEEEDDEVSFKRSPATMY